MSTPSARRPQAVEVTSWLMWLLVVGGLAVSVVAVVRRDELADAWAPLHPTDTAIQPVTWLPVVLVLYAVIAITVLLLVAMFRQAQTWTRYALTLLGLGLTAGSFAIMRTAPPTSVRIALVAAAIVAALSVVFLWHPGVTGFLRGDPQEEADERH